MNTAELKKLQSEITQGDWFTKDNHQVFANLNGVEYVIAFCYDAGAANGEVNAEAIALLPKLLRENEQLREALKTLIDQAEEVYPHFESPRGQANIKNAKAALGEKQ